MTHRPRLVIDANALVSRILFPNSTPGRAVRRAIDEAQLLVSDATLDELVSVLTRPKLARFVSVEERQDFVRALGRIIEPVPIVEVVRACRDPRDDMVLEVAVNGAADVIVTGDRDLLKLDPFRSIAILAPARYLAS